MTGGNPQPRRVDAAQAVAGQEAADFSRADPIFIHGISPRSGTNFLWDLVLLHPDCAPAVAPVREDLLLDRSDHLLAFAGAVRTAWDPNWGYLGPELQNRLYAALGEGLVSFLWADRDRRLVSKSPSVRHLERFFSFFPTARLLVLVRDGRAVTQSCMDTFGWSFERAARAWAAAADEIDRFRESNAGRAERWRLVRYEELIDDLDGHLSALLQFAELDPARYDMDAARDLPVRGSSAYFGPGRSAVNWEPAAKDSSFTPKERWRSWTPRKLERFEWLAGDQLRRLGYETQPQVAAIPALRHRRLDAAWATGNAARHARRRLGSATRPLRGRLGLIP